MTLKTIGAPKSTFDEEPHKFERNPNRRESVCKVCGKGESQHSK